MAECLRASCALTALDLSYNKLGAKGAQLLAEALKENDTLAELVLVSCGCGEKGGRALLRGLEENGAVVAMSVEGNGIGRQTLEKVARQVGRNRARVLRVVEECAAEEEEVRWNRVACMLLGKGRAGKSSLLRALTQQRFDASIASTKGVEVCALSARSGGRWWFAKEKEYTQDMLYRLAAAKLLAGKLAGGGKVERGGGMGEEVEERVEDGEEDGKSVGGGGLQLAEEEKLSSVLQTKAKQGSLDIVMWDFGGQDCFHVSHHLFWSPSALYILVFDLREQLHESVQLWMKLLRLYVPKSAVILAGTFHAKFEGNLKELDAAIRGFSELPEKLVENGASVFFPVDNETLSGIESLKKSIDAVARQQESVALKLPLRWVQCLDAMISASKAKGWIALDEVHRLALQLGMEKQEVSDMLSLFHSLRAIVHFTSSTYLIDTITTNPQWLVDSIAAIIHDSKLHETDQEELKRRQLVADYERFAGTGVASRSLLECLWTTAKVDFLVELTRRLLLLSDWPRAEEKERLYFVPSMAPTEARPTQREKGFKCILDFANSFIPPGLFARLVCCCLAYASMNSKASVEPVVSRSAATFCFDGTGVIHVIRQEDRLLLWVENEAGAALGLQIILAMMRKIKADFKLGRLEWKTMVETTESNSGRVLLDYAQAIREKWQPWFKVANAEELQLRQDLASIS